jgi:hypothetical protein
VDPVVPGLQGTPGLSQLITVPAGHGRSEFRLHGLGTLVSIPRARVPGWHGWRGGDSPAGKAATVDPV